MYMEGLIYMDVKEITQKIIDTYKVAQPLYGNDAPIYGNNTPICPPNGEMYEQLYKLFSYFHDTKPELLHEIDNCNDVLTLADISGELELIKSSLPEELKPGFETLTRAIQIISFWHRFK